ncbi:hypothetical protein B7494_g4362 [Chlorociboria aeruginascens]|nr:hypothetical protein B7494_g4362 [Chlorociboria aeruginascens]
MAPGASLNLIYVAGISLVAYLVISAGYRLFYNLFLHPLKHIPGPKLAAATFLYQTYFSLVVGSRYYVQIGKLHEKYGPVVRITPDEVHLSDPDNYDTIYHVGSKYSKAPPYYSSMGIAYSTVSAMSNETHRVRRGRLNPFFSRKMVLELEDVVHTRTDKLCSVVADRLKQNRDVDIHHGFRAVSVDIISEYAFGDCYNLLDRPDLGMDFFFMVQGLGPMMWTFMQWPGLQKFALSLPPAVSKAISPPMKQLLGLQEHAYKQILSVKSDMESGKGELKPTIFHDLLTADEKLGYYPPRPDQLKDEAYSILAAAADTTGNAMTVAAYRVISDPVIYRKLTDELKGAFPDPNAKLDYLSLEKLPYLTGVIKEAIRLSFGAPGRLPRVVPEPGASFNGIDVPGGAYISMSTWELHHNEDYFPNATKFDPDRWADPQNVRHMEKAYVPFGKGSRACVGINLAYCELYVVLGTLFRRFEHLQGNKLGPKDLVYDDYLSAYPPMTATRFHLTGGS